MSLYNLNGDHFHNGLNNQHNKLSTGDGMEELASYITYLHLVEEGIDSEKEKLNNDIFSWLQSLFLTLPCSPQH